MKLDDLARTAGREMRNAARRVHQPDVPTMVAWRRRRAGIATALVAAVVVVIAIAVTAPFTTGGEPTFTNPADPSPSTTAAPTTTTGVVATVEPTWSLPATGPAFGDETGTVLLFVDGIDGVLAVDLDRRMGSRRAVEGWRAGDPPHLLRRVGDLVVGGWGEIHGLHLADGDSTLLGLATIFVPAAEPDRVWMVDWEGGRIGSGAATAWQVDMQGRQVTEPAPLPAGGHPVIGVPGGLALESEWRLHLWYPESGLGETISDGGFVAADTHGDLLAFCYDADCTDLRIMDFRRGGTFGGTPPGGGNWWSARFSPDGERIAMTSETSLVVADARTGEIVGAALDRFTGPGWAFIAWSPDGTQVFAAHSSYGEPEMTIARYDIPSGTARSVTLPFGGGIDFIVLDRSEAEVFIRDQDQEPDACPAPMSYPTGRTEVCGFRY